MATEQWIDVDREAGEPATPRVPCDDGPRTHALMKFVSRYPHFTTREPTIACTKLGAHGNSRGHADPRRIFADAVQTASRRGDARAVCTVCERSKFHFNPASVTRLKDGTVWCYCPVGGSNVHRAVWVLTGAHAERSWGFVDRILQGVGWLPPGDPPPVTYCGVRFQDD